MAAVSTFESSKSGGMMMRLPDVSARAHPDGNRVDLLGQPEPVPDGYRLTSLPPGRLPTTAGDGTGHHPAAGEATHSDRRPARAKLTYYYTFLPVVEHGRSTAGPANRAAATATSPYGLGELCTAATEIYRRYDIATLLRGDRRRSAASASRRPGPWDAAPVPRPARRAARPASTAWPA